MTSGMVTVIPVMYRDADNNKVFASYIAAGAISTEQRTRLAATLGEDGRFVAEQVGLPHAGAMSTWSFPTADVDHAWHELAVGDIVTATSMAVTVDSGPIGNLVAAFERAAENGWNADKFDPTSYVRATSKGTDGMTTTLIEPTVQTSDTADGATVVLTDPTTHATATLSGAREQLLDTLQRAVSGLRRSPQRVADHKRTLWETVADAVAEQLGGGDAEPTGAELAAQLGRIRVRSEYWDNGHFPLDEVEVWLGDSRVPQPWEDGEDRADDVVSLLDLASIVDFEALADISIGERWEYNLTRLEAAAAASRVPTRKAHNR